MLEQPHSCPCPSCPEQLHLVLAPGPVKSVLKSSEKDWPVDEGGEGQKIRMKACHVACVQILRT